MKFLNNISRKIWKARKSWIPAFTWRVITTLISMFILYYLNGSIALAIKFAIIEFPLKWVLLSYHNEVWRKYYKKKSAQERAEWRQKAHDEMGALLSDRKVPPEEEDVL